MFCVNCQKEIDPDLVTGADIYGPLTFNKSEPFARCPHCGNYGEYATDKNEPYLIIPDFRLRKAYNYIDSILDLIWMQKKMWWMNGLPTAQTTLFPSFPQVSTHSMRSLHRMVM